jgi:hypothetical protein
MCIIDNKMGQSVSIYNFANTKALAQATLHTLNNKMWDTGFQVCTLDVKRFVMSVGLEDLDERETLLVLSGIFLQNP